MCVFEKVILILKLMKMYKEIRKRHRMAAVSDLEHKIDNTVTSTVCHNKLLS